MDSVKSDGTSAVAGKNAMELVQFGAMVDFMWLAAATISEPWRPQVTGSSWHVMDLFDTYVYVYIKLCIYYIYIHVACRNTYLIFVSVLSFSGYARTMCIQCRCTQICIYIYTYTVYIQYNITMHIFFVIHIWHTGSICLDIDRYLFKSLGVPARFHHTGTKHWNGPVTSGIFFCFRCFRAKENASSQHWNP